MNKAFRYILSGCICLLSSFNTVAQDNLSAVQLQLDHVLIFVNSTELEDSLNKWFTPAEKLATQHTKQGTSGHYYLFLNTFIELLYLEDRSKAIENEKNFGSPYTRRWDNSSETSPFSLGVNMIPFDTNLVQGKYHKYYSGDTNIDEFYLMSKGNNDQAQPMIYASMPHRAHKQYKSIEEVDQKVNPQIKEDLKKYLSHPNNIQKLEKVIITVPKEHFEGINTTILKNMDNVELVVGTKHKMILYFDEFSSGEKSFYSKDFDFSIKY